MLLHRAHLNLRCREVRRDLADPYQMHSTLCRAFVAPNENAHGTFLWRLEPEMDNHGNARLILQSHRPPDWNRIEIKNYFLGNPDPPLEHFTRLKLDQVKAGKSFRFRLRANPCITKMGKRFGLFKQEDQKAWLIRKGLAHGFQIEGFRISDERMLLGRKRNTDIPLKIFSVLFDGFLRTDDPQLFLEAIAKGIGHGKAFGLGLLTIIPIDHFSKMG